MQQIPPRTRTGRVSDSSHGSHNAQGNGDGCRSSPVCSDSEQVRPAARSTPATLLLPVAPIASQPPSRGSPAWHLLCPTCVAPRHLFQWGALSWPCLLALVPFSASVSTCSSEFCSPGCSPSSVLSVPGRSGFSDWKRVFAYVSIGTVNTAFAFWQNYFSAGTKGESSPSQ